MDTQSPDAVLVIDNELTSEFRSRFPLLFARLDTPEKVRIFLDAVDFWSTTVENLGSVFQILLHKHEVGREQVTTYAQYAGGEWFRGLRIVLHKGLQAQAVVQLLLPGCLITKDHKGLHFDWRTDAERAHAKRSLIT
jgi:hypothetical protein